MEKIAASYRREEIFCAHGHIQAVSPGALCTYHADAGFVHPLSDKTTVIVTMRPDLHAHPDFDELAVMFDGDRRLFHDVLSPYQREKGRYELGIEGVEENVFSDWVSQATHSAALQALYDMYTLEYHGYTAKLVVDFEHSTRLLPNEAEESVFINLTAAPLSLYHPAEIKRHFKGALWAELAEDFEMAAAQAGQPFHVRHSDCVAEKAETAVLPAGDIVRLAGHFHTQCRSEDIVRIAQTTRPTWKQPALFIHGEKRGTVLH